MLTVAEAVKTCTKCLTEKALADFAKNMNYCRVCNAARFKEWYAANRERNCQKSAAWSAANAARHKATTMAWKDSNRERLREYARTHRTKRVAPYISERACAIQAVGKALRSGKIQRHPCWVCGDPKTDGHHSSYAKDMRLAVVWLCRLHHRQTHALLPRPKRAA